MTQQLLNVSNYIVPAAGTTRGYSVRKVFDPLQPDVIDFRQIALDGQPYRPSGVFVDNTRNSDPLTVVVNEIGFTIIVPAGANVATPYPAPIQHSVTIIGNGEAVLVFVDFPVIPQGFDGGAGAVSPWGASDVADVVAINSLTVGTNERLDDVKANLATVDASLATVDASLATVNDSVGVSNTRLQTLATDTAAIKDELASLSGYLTFGQSAILEQISTNTQPLTQIAGDVATVASETGAAASILGDLIQIVDAISQGVQGLLGVDSTYGPLPNFFDSLPRAFTYDGSGNVLTEARTDGFSTWTKTYAYTGNNRDSESAWVKS